MKITKNNIMAQTTIFLKKTKIETREDYQTLNAVIAYHDRLYQNEDTEIIVDTDYDQLMFLMQATQKDHPDWVTGKETNKQIAGQASSKLPKVKHPIPVLSLEKKQISNLDSMSDYLNKWKPITQGTEVQDSKDFATDGFVLQSKLDGLSIVIYTLPSVNHGRATVATRGGGEEGEDVTEAFRNIPGFADILDRLPKGLIIRGETVINKADFEKMVETGENEGKNDRNLVAGSVRTNDPTVARKRHAHFVAYDLVNYEDAGVFSEVGVVDKLKSLGFDVPPTRYFPNTKAGIKDLQKALTTAETTWRDQQPYSIDGMVVKPNAKPDHQELTAHHPVGPAAFKFPAEEQITTIRKVIFQVGVKGQVTPVAVVDPVNILGATITRASLANMDNIKTRHLMLNQVVTIRRSNDVIPQILGPVAGRQTGEEIEILPPKNVYFNGPIMMSNSVTEEQILNRLTNYVSKKALDIEGLSKQTLALLYHNQLIDEHFASLYQLTGKQSEMISLDGLGQKKTDTIISEIEKSKHAGLKKVLIGIGARGFSRELAAWLAENYESYDAFKQDNDWQTHLTTSKGFSGSAIKILSDFIKNDEPELRALQDAGVDLSGKRTNVKATMAGMTVVVTGSTQTPRALLKNKVEERGGKLAGTVSKKTDYLVTNETSESSKAKKAQELHVPVITESQLDELIAFGRLVSAKIDESVSNDEEMSR